MTVPSHKNSKIPQVSPSKNRPVLAVSCLVGQKEPTGQHLKLEVRVMWTLRKQNNHLNNIKCSATNKNDLEACPAKAVCGYFPASSSYPWWLEFLHYHKENALHLAACVQGSSLRVRFPQTMNKAFKHYYQLYQFRIQKLLYKLNV